MNVRGRSTNASMSLAVAKVTTSLPAERPKASEKENSFAGLITASWFPTSKEGSRENGGNFQDSKRIDHPNSSMAGSAYDSVRLMCNGSEKDNLFVQPTLLQPFLTVISSPRKSCMKLEGIIKAQ